MEGRSEYVIDKDELWYKNTTGRTYHKHNRERAMLSLKIQRTGSSDDLVMTRLRGCVKLRALEQSLLPANTKFFKDFLSTKTYLTRLVFLSRTDVWFCYLLFIYRSQYLAGLSSRLPKRRKQRKMVHEHARLIQWDQPVCGGACENAVHTNRPS